jgi:exodeoxyribonuclease VII large subunit
MSDSPFLDSLTSDNANEPTVLTVEGLNRQIKQLMEGELGLVWVRAEISNFKAHTSGHFYFSLKDSKSQISAVMFRGSNSRLKFKPTDGLEVIVRGRISVYEPRGSYQILCEMMEPVGAGALQKAFEQLKTKLKAEGLFEQAKKRPLPALPKHIAIVTSPTGAAIRDMINVLSRRNKSVNITLVPTIVQGEAAAPKIIEAMQKAFLIPNLDVIIVGRGGGSIEDMWCFNDEALARVIAGSPVPVISAVGHEIDFTIADFVADLRAPTPSAAAELVVKNTSDLVHRLVSLESLLKMSIGKTLRSESLRLKNLTSLLVDPKRRLLDLVLRNDELWTRLNHAMRSFLERKRMEIKLAKESLTSPDQVLNQKRSEIELLQLKMRTAVDRKLENRSFGLKNAMAKLDTLSPLKVVDRGYSVVTSAGKLIKSYKQVKNGDELNIQLSQGQLIANVIEVKKEEESSWTLKRN